MYKKNVYQNITVEFEADENVTIAAAHVFAIIFRTKDIN